MQASSKKLIYQLIVSTLLMALIFATIGNVMALFVTPISQALGVSRSSVVLLKTVLALASILGAPIWGRLYGSVHVKIPLLAGVATVATMLYLMGIAQTLNQIYLLAALLGFVFAGTAVMPVTLIISEAAPERQRAFMLSIALAGSGLGGMVLNPLVNSLIVADGYSKAFLFLSILISGTLLPLIAFLPVPPRDRRSSVTPSANLNQKNRARPKLNVKTLVLVSIASFFATFAFSSIGLNFPSYLHLCGYDASMISIMTALSSGSLMAGKILLGVMYDRLGTKHATLLASFTAIVAIVCLIMMPNTAALVSYVLFIGLGMAIGTVTPSYLAAIFFREDWPQAMGYVQVAMGLGTASGVPALAKLMEVIPRFQLSWLLTLIFTILMILLFLWSIQAHSKRYPEPTKIV